jgi:hypothetical protein
MKHTLNIQDDHRFYKTDRSSLSGVHHTRYCRDLTLCLAKVDEFQISETKFDSLFDETITTIKKREQTMIDSVRKYSIELQKQIELDRKSK